MRCIRRNALPAVSGRLCAVPCLRHAHLTRIAGSRGYADMTLRTLLFIGFAFLGAGTAPAQMAPPPPQEPILRIDPGMHTAPIFRIGVDAACTLLATGSYDKTVRLWRRPE